MRKLILLSALGSFVVACSSSQDQGSTTAGMGGGASTGGSSSSATGGSTNSSAGGASQTGGSSQVSGSTGGSTSTGGSSTDSTGGTSTGGASSSPATGGAATGGTSAGSTTGGSPGTGGAATGGAATGGSSSTPVTPTMISAGDYQLSLGSVVIDINPQQGARVSKLTYTPSGSSATNIIVPYTCASYDPNSTCNNSGSTFWTSPQSGWDGVVGGSNVWPPLAAIDGNPYTASITGNHLVLTGSADTNLGASVTKDFSADSGTGWITVTYTINATTKSVPAAPWQITRVPRGGIVFFPLTALVSNTTSPQWVLSPSGGYEWINDATQTSITSGGPKVIADGGTSGQADTWLAYALSGNLLLIKYPNIASSAFASGEADTEVYPGSGYIELEAQGALSTIAAGSNSTWTVKWRVVPIPSSVTVSAGSTSLATFAESQAAL